MASIWHVWANLYDAGFKFETQSALHFGVIAKLLLLHYSLKYASICQPMRSRNVPHIFILTVLVVALLTACTPVEKATFKTAANFERAAETIGINSASKEELQRIPFVGEKLAEAIIEHRERYGPFRRPEQLLLIKGVSDARFRQIKHLIRVD